MQKGAVLQRIRCESLIEMLRKEYEERKIQEKIYGFFKLSEGKPATLRLAYKGTEVQITGDVAEPAKNQPTTGKQIQKQLQKTGNTLFVFETLEIEVSGNCFFPVQQLNQMRRKGLEELQRKTEEKYHRQCPLPVLTGKKVCCQRKMRKESCLDRKRNLCPGVQKRQCVKYRYIQPA